MMNADVIIVGGGLSGGLLALRLASTHPEKRVLLLERGATLGGNHTWSFHESDLRTDWRGRNAGSTGGSKSGGSSDDNQALWLQPLIAKSWTSHEVRFPALKRTIQGSYHSIRSEFFHSVLMERLGRNIRLNCDVLKTSACAVETSLGDVLRAPLVIDATGISSRNLTDSTFRTAPCGWQKFIGYDVKLKNSHGLEHPILKDVCVPQMDGYRFFYCLPWSENRLLVEETFYSMNPDLNRERISRSILAYIERQGWQLESIERREEGALPLPLVSPEGDGGDLPLHACTGEDFQDDSPVRISSGVGWFHSTTGYSLPDAVRVADFICDLTELRSGPVRAKLRQFRYTWSQHQKFYRTLNRLLFKAAEPSLRYQVLENFYSLPEDLIERFYAGLTTPRDRVRILSGKPPVRIKRALKNWKEQAPPASVESEA